MISVIITTHKRDDYLSEAVESVQQQRQSDFEVIIIDDDPDREKRPKIVSKYPTIRYYLNNSNVGPGKSRLRGMELARGEYIFFMDDDDYYTDNLLFKRSSEILDEDNHLAFVGFNAFIYNEATGSEEKKFQLNTIGRVDQERLLSNLGLGMNKPLSTFTSLFRKSALCAQNLNDIQNFDDMTIYLLASLSGSAMFVRNFIGCYRVHGNGITSSLSAEFVETLIHDRIQISKMSPVLTRRWVDKQILGAVLYMRLAGNEQEMKKLFKWLFALNERFALRAGYGLLCVRIKEFLKWIIRGTE